MMQVMEFLTLYAEELFLLMVSLAVILLLVTLHRMRRIAKLLRTIAGDTKQIVQEQRVYTEVIQAQKEVMGKARTKAVPKERTQEKLISEVLDEVFP